MNVNTVTELGPQSNSCEGSSRAASQCPATGYVPLDTHNALHGRDLRYVLTHYISRGYRTVAELVNQLAEDGFTVWGRASKVVSDALRWEVRNGRVRRIRRGHYGIATIPRTTFYRIRTRSRSLFFAPHVVAIRRNIPRNAIPSSPPPADRFWREWRETRSISRTNR